MKFTDEQLSRILGEHAAGQLQRLGMTAWGRPTEGKKPIGCIVQAAYNLEYVAEACRKNLTMTCAFDGQYRASWTPEEFLQWIAKHASH